MASALASCSRSSVGSSVDRPSRSRIAQDVAAASRSLLGSTFKHGEGVLRCSSGRGGERARKLVVTAKRVAFVEPPEVLDRFRLNNLAPQPGSRKRNKRKGRGHSAGQGGSCGAGMRGQLSRAGPKVRPGFEGGQMPLYRRIPKLKGIAGGMRRGVPKYIPVNLKDIAEGFSNGEEVSLETLTSKRMINPSGKDKKLPLKILGDADEEFKLKLSIKARAFSKSAKEKLEAAGCTVITLPGPKKWVKPSVAKNIKRAEDYFARKKGLVPPSEES